MQSIYKIISVVFVIVIGLYIYTLYKNKNLFPSASLEIINKSENDIKEIIIEHSNGKIIHLGLKINQKVKYPIYILGEGSYSIQIIFLNYKIKPIENMGYIEAGYNLVEIIHNNEIVEHNALW